MIVSALTSILIGLALAIHFRVFVLLPLFGLTFIVAGMSTFWPHASGWRLAFTLFIIIVGLQIGYILGVGVRHAKLVMRANRIRSGSFANARVQRQANWSSGIAPLTLTSNNLWSLYGQNLLEIWGRKRLSRPAILGWMLCVLGLGLWAYGYFASGSPPMFDWAAHTPIWISEFMPTENAEIGMALMVAGSGLTYWPKRQEQ
jgi:hypothetical protein